MWLAAAIGVVSVVVDASGLVKQASPSVARTRSPVVVNGSVSCVSPTFCVAVGRYGDARRFDGARGPRLS
jgi:hypothetical protein